MRERNRLLKLGRMDQAWLSFSGRSDGAVRRAHGPARVPKALVRLSQAQNTAQTDAKSLSSPRQISLFWATWKQRFHQVIRDSSAPDDDLNMTEIEEAAGLAGRLSDSRPRDAAAGRTLEGPHRSDLEGRLCRQADAGQGLFDRRAEGAADLFVPGKCQGTDGPHRRNADPAAGRSRSTPGCRPAAARFMQRSRHWIARPG